MKIFVQSTSMEELRQAADAGLMDGIAISLAHLTDADPAAKIKDQVAEIASAFAVPVCVPVSMFTQADIYRDARELTRGAEHLVIQVPFLEDAVIPIRKLVADGVKICATHVYNGAQAFLAAKIGATMVSVPADDLDEHGQRSAHVVSEIRDVIDQADVECDLMVSSLHSATNFTECLLAGAKIVCVTPALLHTMMLHPLTDRGVDRFLQNLSRRRKLRRS